MVAKIWWQQEMGIGKQMDHGHWDCKLSLVTTIRWNNFSNIFFKAIKLHSFDIFVPEAMTSIHRGSGLFLWHRIRYKNIIFLFMAKTISGDTLRQISKKKRFSTQMRQNQSMQWMVYSAKLFKQDKLEMLDYPAESYNFGWVLNLNWHEGRQFFTPCPILDQILSAEFLSRFRLIWHPATLIARTYLQTPLPLPEFFPIGQWNKFK